MTRALRVGLALLSLTAAACASGAAPNAPPRLPDVSAIDDDGHTRDLRAEMRAAPLAVITFFSARCPCQRAHDARLRALYETYRPRGVAFVAIDAERGASAARDTSEARARAYPFPIWSDPQGRAADSLGAEYATYTLVVDGGGEVRYAGGIDSDRSHLTDDAVPYVRDALDDLLAGRALRAPRGKVLGCALER